MNRRMSAVMAVIALGILIALYGCSRDEHTMEGEHHEGMEQGGMMEQHEGMGPEEHGRAMERQHESMMRLQEEWMKAKSAIEKGETAGAAGAAKEMQDAARMQEEFMLHRNAESRADFLEKSDRFRSLIMRFRATAEKGDKASLKEIAPEIDQACNECHQAFR